MNHFLNKKVKKVFVIYIKLSAAIALICAGAIHTFPSLWQAWDNLIEQIPAIHGIIGAIAFSLGIANFCLCAFEICAIPKRTKFFRSQSQFLK
jgi:hypothetical protein